MIAVAEFWPALLECRAALKQGVNGARKSGVWRFLRDPHGIWQFAQSDTSAVWSLDGNQLCCDLAQPMPEDLRAGLGLIARYLDLLIAQANWQCPRPMTTGSVAQSLDGFIATTAGDSQWIGNEANLIHAHRLRALHDAILVGCRTLERDCPALTVRKVPGENPQRIVVTSRTSLPSEKLACLRGPTLILKPAAESGRLQTAHPLADFETVLGDEGTGKIAPANLLSCLARRGISSVMIEGGGCTLSHINAAGLLDTLDVHIAPVFLGDGIASLTTPAATCIAEVPEHPSRVYILDSQTLVSVELGGALA